MPEPGQNIEAQADAYARQTISPAFADALLAHDPSCPHCPDGHGLPSRTAWGVRVDTLVDGDRQPVRLIVEPTAGAHVAQPDADWLFQLIRNRDRILDHSVTLNAIGWALSEALGDVAPFASSREVLEMCHRLIARMKDAEQALVELAPYRQPDEVLELNTEYLSIPVNDLTYQWGFQPNPDVAVATHLSFSEAAARFHARRDPSGMAMRRPVGPWEEAPPAAPLPEPVVVHMTALCDVAGGIPVRLALPLQPDAKEPELGEQVTLGCAWDGRHQHAYTVVSEGEYELAMPGLFVPQALKDAVAKRAGDPL